MSQAIYQIRANDKDDDDNNNNDDDDNGDDDDDDNDDDNGDDDNDTLYEISSTKMTACDTTCIKFSIHDKNLSIEL